ncbi:hypothetical protein, partial [Mesomycoplasma ovipneumoniae]|uniref:hypothetical protein n=1 Tax=Mesomycoplasma ovipneumoniae TaxID=29562 RepID=UPI003080D964
MRKDSAYVGQRLALRGLANVEEKIMLILDLDKQIRALKTALETRQAEMNKLAKAGKNAENIE